MTLFEFFNIVHCFAFTLVNGYKKMKGADNKYRLRIGEYRLLYEIFRDRVLIYVYVADTRGDVYK